MLWGSGEQTRDLLYVDDAAQAFLLALENGTPWSCLNLGTGIETSIRDLAAQIAKLVGYEGPIHWTKALGGQQRRVLDSSKARDLLGWSPTTDLETGLKRTIEWVQEELSYACA